MELVPDYASAEPALGGALGIHSGTQPTQLQETAVGLSQTLAPLMAMVQQALQSNVGPVLEQVLAGQEVVMSRLERLEREQHHRSIVPQTSGESVVQQLQSMTIGPSPRAVTFDDRAAFQAAPLASESGRSLTSADASHAIVQSPPSDVGRTDGAGKGAEYSSRPSQKIARTPTQQLLSSRAHHGSCPDH